MCNNYAANLAIQALIDASAKAGMPIIDPAPNARPNLEPKLNIRPTDIAPILRSIEGGLQLAQLRWGLVPWFHKGTAKEWRPLTTNCRSETAATTATFKQSFAKRRCIVPASSFFEWTGEKGKKNKWEITVPNQEWFGFAGLWDETETPDGPLQSFTILTLASGRWMEKYHDRQPLILRTENMSAWLNNSQSLDILIDDAKQQSLHIELAGNHAANP